MRPPWIIVGAVSQDPAAFPWELYDLRNDWAQSEDVAAKQPAKLKEMQNLFWAEAKKYQVLPSLGRGVARRLSAPSLGRGVVRRLRRAFMSPTISRRSTIWRSCGSTGSSSASRRS